MQIELGPLTIRPIHVILGALALSLIAVIIVLAVMLPGRNADTGSMEPVEEAEHPWATADRLVVPEDFSRLEFEWVPYRGRRSVWTPEQVGEYWYDPNEIGLEILGERLEAEIRSLLEAPGP
jgi:hypothetical protein